MTTRRAHRLIPLLLALGLAGLLGVACDRADNDWDLYDPGLKRLAVVTDTLVLAEGGASRTFRLSLLMVPDDTVRVLVAADDSQIVAEPDTVVIVPIDDDWARPRTVSVHALDDRIDEATAYTSVSLAVVSRDVDFDGQGGDGLVPVVIVDDDSAGVHVSESALTLVESTGGAVAETYRVRLLSQPVADVTVDVTASPVDPSFHVDPVSLVFTPADWNTEQEIRLWAELDQVDADNMVFTLDHAATSADPVYDAFPGIAAVTVQLYDDTLPPTASLALAVPGNTTLVESAGTTSLDVVVSLDRSSVLPVTVNLATRDDGATGGADFVAVDTDLVFAPGGALSRTVSIAALDDVLMEDPEDFQVLISAVANVIVGEQNRLDLTIVDDDRVTLSVVGVGADEDAGGAGFRVSLPFAVPLPVVFTLTTADGTATAGADYTALDEEYGIPAGSTVRFVPLAVVPDGFHESDETLTATLSGVSGNASWDGVTASLTIADDDPQTVTLAAAPMHDGTSRGWFRLRLAHPYDHDVGLTLNTVDGDGIAPALGQEDARGGPDFVVQTSRAWTLRAGVTADSIGVDLMQDNAAEAAVEYFRLRVSAATEPEFVGLEALAALADADQPQIVVTDATVTEVDPQAAFTVSLVNDVGNPVTSQADVSVHIATVDQTATGDVDYTATAATVVLPAGSAGVAFNVPILDDAHDDDNETFVLSLTAPVNAGIADDGSAPFCLLVDNEFPSINLGQTVFAENEGSTHRFRIFLTTARQDATSFVLALDQGNSGGAGVDYTFAAAGGGVVPPFTTELFFDVPYLDDQLAGEPVETLQARILSAGVALGVETLDMQIIDAPALNIAPDTGPEGSNLVFDVSLTAASTADITFSVQYSSGTANVLTDIVSTATGPFTIPAGATSFAVVTPTVAGDGGDLAVEDFVITVINPVNATLGAFNSATGQITDTDPSPLYLAGDATALEGDAVAFTVQLAWTSEADVQFQVAFSDGTAAGAGIDYVDTGTGPFTIPAGASSTVISVPTTALDGPELAVEDFTITLISPVNGAIGAPATATGFVQDGDQPLLTIPAGDTAVEGQDMQFTIHLDPPTIVPVFFDLVFSDGSTQGAADFVPSSTGPFSMMPGTTDTTITVSTIDDAIFENTEQFVVRVAANPTNARVGTPAQANGVINDND